MLDEPRRFLDLGPYVAEAEQALREEGGLRQTVEIPEAIEHTPLTLMEASAPEFIALHNTYIVPNRATGSSKGKTTLTNPLSFGDYLDQDFMRLVSAAHDADQEKLNERRARRRQATAPLPITERLAAGIMSVLNLANETLFAGMLPGPAANAKQRQLLENAQQATALATQLEKDVA